MSHARKRGWNRAVLDNRLGLQDSRRSAATEAEVYLELGMFLRRRLRRDRRIDSYAHQVNIPLPECRCALRYADSSSGLILRALVENWPWAKIQRELRCDVDFAKS